MSLGSLRLRILAGRVSEGGAGLVDANGSVRIEF